MWLRRGRFTLFAGQWRHVAQFHARRPALFFVPGIQSWRACPAPVPSKAAIMSWKIGGPRMIHNGRKTTHDGFFPLCHSRSRFHRYFPFRDTRSTCCRSLWLRVPRLRSPTVLPSSLSFLLSSILFEESALFFAQILQVNISPLKIFCYVGVTF